jgi:hypothetical protein
VVVECVSCGNIAERRAQENQQHRAALDAARLEASTFEALLAARVSERENQLAETTDSGNENGTRLLEVCPRETYAVPTLQGLRIDPPKDGREFEDIVLAAVRHLWRSPSFVRHGRSGQSQQGIDLYGPDDLGRLTGVQCKATATLTIADVKAEAEQADSFVPSLSGLYVASILPSNSDLQRRVRILSDDRIRAGRCPLGLLFWETISGELIRDKAALSLHYPHLAANESGGTDPAGSRLLSALDIGHLGTNLRFRMELVFGEWGMLAQENPHAFARVTLRLESCGDVLLAEPRRADFRHLTRDLLATSLRLALGEATQGETWATAEGLATRVEAFVESLEIRLPPAELAAFTAGRLLARWEEFDDGKLPKDLITLLVEAVSTLGISAELITHIRAKAQESEANASIMTIHIPGELYGDIRKHLRSREFLSLGANE